MVKVRPGTRKGQMKITTSRMRAARAHAGRYGKRAHQRQHVAHPAIREAWDRRLTPTENLARVGLCASVNVVDKKPESDVRVVKLSDVEQAEVRKQRASKYETADVEMQSEAARPGLVLKKLEEDASVREAGTKQVVRPGERVALQRLVDKYGSDWTKMARDTKLNYLQWTPNQLEKRVTRMKRIISASK